MHKISSKSGCIIATECPLATPGIFPGFKSVIRLEGGSPLIKPDKKFQGDRSEKGIERFIANASYLNCEGNSLVILCEINGNYEA
jgi:hypothetical protein